jgi:hypothetical protein
MKRDGSVDYTVQARIDLASLLQRAQGRPRFRELVDSVQTAERRLLESPRSIGEPQYHLPAMKMTVMSLTVPPLYILYGVHDDQNVVVVRRIIQI